MKKINYFLITLTGLMWGMIVTSGQFFSNLGFSLFEIPIYIYVFSSFDHFDSILYFG
jgi:hypothetical protein